MGVLVLTEGPQTGNAVRARSQRRNMNDRQEELAPAQGEWI